MCWAAEGRVTMTDGVLTGCAIMSTSTNGVTATPPPVWSVDNQGYIYAPSGCKLARVDADGRLWLWDKRSKAELPLTAETLWALTQTHRGAA